MPIDAGMDEAGGPSHANVRMKRLAGIVCVTTLACGAAEQPTRPAALLTYFDSIAAIHQAHPDTALVRRLHPGPDTLLSIEDTVFEQFTGDSLFRRVLVSITGSRICGSGSRNAACCSSASDSRSSRRARPSIGRTVLETTSGAAC